MFIGREPRLTVPYARQSPMSCNDVAALQGITSRQVHYQVVNGKLPPFDNTDTFPRTWNADTIRKWAIKYNAEIARNENRKAQKM